MIHSIVVKVREPLVFFLIRVLPFMRFRIADTFFVRDRARLAGARAHTVSFQASKCVVLVLVDSTAH